MQEARLRLLKQGCLTLLKNDRRAAQELPIDVLRDKHRSEVGVGAEVVAKAAFYRRICHFKLMGIFLLPVRVEQGGNTSWPSVEPPAPFARSPCCQGVQLRREYVIANFL